MASRYQRKFARALKRATKRLTQDEAALFLKKVAFDALAGVLEKSPVDTGRFKANWRVGINAPDRSTIVGRKDTSPVGTPGRATSTFARVSTKLAKVKGGSTIYISNNLPYAQVLEDGSSQQAQGPNAIVGRTFRELLAQFK